MIILLVHEKNQWLTAPLINPIPIYHKISAKCFLNMWIIEKCKIYFYMYRTEKYILYEQTHFCNVIWSIFRWMMFLILVPLMKCNIFYIYNMCHTIMVYNRFDYWHICVVHNRILISNIYTQRSSCIQFTTTKILISIFMSKMHRGSVMLMCIMHSIMMLRMSHRKSMEQCWCPQNVSSYHNYLQNTTHRYTIE